MTECALTSPKVVPKVWGREIWIVNIDEYCCKLLDVNKGASGSLHYHKEKKETFMIAIGKIQLEVDKQVFTMKAGPKTITILPGTPHRFKALKTSSILEVSTHHREDDVVRIEESKG